MACGFGSFFSPFPKEEKEGLCRPKGLQRRDELTFRDVLAFREDVPSSESASTRSHFLKLKHVPNIQAKASCSLHLNS